MSDYSNLVLFGIGNRYGFAQHCKEVLDEFWTSYDLTNVRAATELVIGVNLSNPGLAYYKTQFRCHSFHHTSLLNYGDMDDLNGVILPMSCELLLEMERIGVDHHSGYRKGMYANPLSKQMVIDEINSMMPSMLNLRVKMPQEGDLAPCRLMNVPVMKNLNPITFKTYNKTNKKKYFFYPDLSNYEEISVDFATGNNPAYMCRRRMAVKGGKSTAAKVFDCPVLNSMMESFIMHETKKRRPYIGNLQFFHSHGRYRLFDFNPRPANGLILSEKLGGEIVLSFLKSLNLGFADSDCSEIRMAENMGKLVLEIPKYRVIDGLA